MRLIALAGGSIDTMPLCPGCNADLMAEYMHIPAPPDAGAANMEKRKTEHCPFCGTEVIPDSEVGLQ